WLNDNLLCRCVDDAFVSAEIIQSTHLNGGRTHVLLQLVIKQNRTDIHRLLGLMLVRENDNHRWLIEDIDDGTEIPSILLAQSPSLNLAQPRWMAHQYDKQDYVHPFITNTIS
ncbi:TPA: hypothetical protein ACSXUP_004520, partial [Escherichia coli]